MDLSASKSLRLSPATVEHLLEMPPIESVKLDWCEKHDIDLRVLRLDLLHPLLGGNKWFKLKHNLQAALESGKRSVLSFGGAYSNHLRALAAAGNLFGVETVGIVRGELVKPLNPVLRFAKDQGMRLIPMDREFYKLKHTEQFSQYLREHFASCYVVPEGGSNALGVKGCGDILNLIPVQDSRKNRIVALPCGTGATFSGLVLKAMEDRIKNTNFFGVSVLKAEGYLQKEVENKLLEMAAQGQLFPIDWRMIDRFHGGGYAKSNNELNHFVIEWNKRTGIPIEPVYTGKLFWGLKEMIEAGEIAAGSEVIAIHTGGVH